MRKKLSRRKKETKKITKVQLMASIYKSNGIRGAVLEELKISLKDFEELLERHEDAKEALKHEYQEYQRKLLNLALINIEEFLNNRDKRGLKLMKEFLIKDNYVKLKELLDKDDMKVKFRLS